MFTHVHTCSRRIHARFTLNSRQIHTGFTQDSHRFTQIHTASQFGKLRVLSYPARRVLADGSDGPLLRGEGDSGKEIIPCVPPASSPDNPTQIYKRPPCARGSFGTSIPMFLTCEERMKISLCHSGKKSGGRGSPDAPDIETSKDGDVSIAPHPPPPRQKRCAHAP